jgi:hypothetical protein
MRIYHSFCRVPYHLVSALAVEYTYSKCRENPTDSEPIIFISLANDLLESCSTCGPIFD